MPEEKIEEGFIYQLDDFYQIWADKRQYMLKKKTQPKDSSIEGTFKTIGFYAYLDFVIIIWMDLVMKEKAVTNPPKGAPELVSLLEEVRAELKTACRNINLLKK